MAVLRKTGAAIHVRAFQPSMSHVELIAALRQGLDALDAYGSRVVFMEKVGYMPRDGGQGANTFGRVDGLLRGGLLMAGYPPRDVYPMMWQSRLGCLTGGNKNISKARAAELFPDVRMTHAIADALLIARYGWECS